MEKKINILIYKATEQNNPTNYLVEILGRNLKKLGHHVMILDISVISRPDIIIDILIKEEIELVLSFDRIQEGLETTLEAMNIIQGIILVEHPFYYVNKAVFNQSKNSFICLYDEGHLYTFEEYINQEMPIAHLFHAGIELPHQQQNKEYDVVVVGNVKKVEPAISQIEELPEGILKSIGKSLYEKVRQGVTVTLDEGFNQEIKSRNLDSKIFRDNLQFQEAIASIYSYVDEQIKNELMYNTLKAMLAAGIKVDLLGDCEVEEFKNNVYFTCHGQLNYLEQLEKIQASKLLVDVSHLCLNGSKEILLSAMLNRTLVLTHQNNYLNGEFIDKESIIYYDLGYKNTLIDSIKYYLQNEPARSTIVEQAYSVTSTKHTWSNRAYEIQEIFEMVRCHLQSDKNEEELVRLHQEVIYASIGEETKHKEELLLQAITSIEKWIEKLATMNTSSNNEDGQLVAVKLCETINILDNSIYSEVLTNNRFLQIATLILEKQLKLEDLIKDITLWTQNAMDTIKKLCQCYNNIDREFYKLVCFIEGNNLGQLKEIMIKNAREIALNESNYYNNLKYFYKKYEDYWGVLDIEENRFDLIEDRSQTLVEHREDFIWLYTHLGDYRSKMVLSGILYNWVTFKLNYISDIKERNFVDYYDCDVLQGEEEEVFVDLGAYTGDSIEGYIKTYGKYKKIYGYEMTPTTFETLKQNMRIYNNIECRQKAIGEKNGKIYIKSVSDEDPSSNKVDNQGNVAIEMVSLDEDITEKITFIKMDIEGAEQAALKGAKNHIQLSKPKLAVCTYHNNEDIWKIPQMIYEMNPEYKFYMRYNGTSWWPSEYVLLCK